MQAQKGSVIDYREGGGLQNGKEFKSSFTPTNRGWGHKRF